MPDEEIPERIWLLKGPDGSLSEYWHLPCGPYPHIGYVLESEVAPPADSEATATFKMGDAPLYTQADLDRCLARVRGSQYAKFLAEHDECGECGNAACRGVELFPMRIDGKTEARCWKCLNLKETSPPADAVERAREIMKKHCRSAALLHSEELIVTDSAAMQSNIAAALSQVAAEIAEKGKQITYLTDALHGSSENVRDLAHKLEEARANHAATVAAEKKKVWDKAIEIVKNEIKFDTTHDLGAHDLEDCAICSALYQGNAIVSDLEAARTADSREAKMTREGITEEDVAETRYPEHWPENR